LWKSCRNKGDFVFYKLIFCWIKENEDEGDAGANPEEESKVEFTPLVALQEVDVKSGEEDETVLEGFKMRCKLFRFDSAAKQWKERGTGDVKFLQHNDTKKVRLLMRREKTLKVCANHFVHPIMKLDAHVGSDRAWVWNCPKDYAEEPASEELFAIRFANSDNAGQFKEMFKKAQQINKESSNESGNDDKELEKNIEKLSVKDDQKQ